MYEVIKIAEGKLYSLGEATKLLPMHKQLGYELVETSSIELDTNGVRYGFYLPKDKDGLFKGDLKRIQSELLLTDKELFKTEREVTWSKLIVETSAGFKYQMGERSFNLLTAVLIDFDSNITRFWKLADNSCILEDIKHKPVSVDKAHVVKSIEAELREALTLGKKELSKMWA